MKLISCTLVLLLVILSGATYGQKLTYDFTAKVTDDATNEPLENITIYFSASNLVGQTNSEGLFSIKLPEGNYQISLRGVGYKVSLERFKLDSSLSLAIRMIAKEELLDEVVISSEKTDANVNRAIMGVEKISGATLKKLPNLMGEADVIRSITMLPGVSTVGEGAAGFNVRGGNVDQNLVLLDGVPLYNTSHLFGFFTGFNADVVQDISLYKGGIPSQYGGKTSSVLDVRLKEGDFDKWNYQIGLGPISSKVMIDGPIVKDKTSIMVAARSSLSDFYLKLFNNPALEKSGANFYDFNAKLTQKIGKTQRISVGGYLSNDNFKFGQDTAYFYRSSNVYVKHNAFILGKISHKLTAYSSLYNYGNKGLAPRYEYKWAPSIAQKSIKEEINFPLGQKSNVDIGLETNFYINDAGSLGPTTDESIINTFTVPKEYSRDFAGFVGMSNYIGKRLNLNYGVRYAIFQLTGPGDFVQYQTNAPRTLQSISDTLSLNKGEVLQTYSGLEPRFSLSFKLDTTFSVKVGVNRMRQYIHLLSNTLAISPVDIWKNSNQYLPPQTSDQVSIGFFKNFINNPRSTYETSVELYYKRLTNLVDYIDGANLFLNPTIETELLTGNGKAYGAEFFIKKTKGIKLTGWLSYTYSRTFRIVEPSENQIGANFGIQFPANFDVPHNFKLVLNNRWNKRVTFNSNISYNTGRPITYPNGRYKLYAYNETFNYLQDNGLIPRVGFKETEYIFNGQTFKNVVRGEITEILDGYSVPSFTLRNAERIPDYFRVDVGLNIDPKENSKLNGTWNISIYNILARKNVYSIYFRSATGLRNQARTYQMSVLGAAIPSITYNIKF